MSEIRELEKRIKDKLEKYDNDSEYYDLLNRLQGEYPFLSKSFIKRIIDETIKEIENEDEENEKEKT